MNTRGRISSLFCERWSERTASGAARKALKEFIPGSSGASLPVNLEAASKFVGIEQITEADLPTVHGLLSSTPSGSYIVSLARGQSRVRKRFTLAHEIGHAIVYKSIGVRGGLSKDGRRLSCGTETEDEIDEERLCDILATELLMPREQFHEFMEHTGVSALAIPMIARRFDVSLQAASRRIANVLSYEIGIGLWTLSDNGSHVAPKWYLTKQGALALPYAIAVGQPGATLFENAPARGWHWLPLHGHMEKYFVDIHPLPGNTKSWLLLVVFSSAAQQIFASISKGPKASE